MSQRDRVLLMAFKLASGRTETKMVTSSTMARLWEVRFHHAWSPPGSRLPCHHLHPQSGQGFSSGARGTARNQETEGVLLRDTCLYVHVFQGCWRQFLEAQIIVTPNWGWASPEICLPVTTTKGPAWCSATFRVAWCLILWLDGASLGSSVSPYPVCGGLSVASVSSSAWCFSCPSK